MKETKITRAFPWDEAMSFGFGVLRLAPDAFWALTPRELAAAYQSVNGDTGETLRPDLARLLALFPDESEPVAG